MSVIDDLQSALAGEHAAVYGYGVIGGRLSGSKKAQALAGLNEHRSTRDQLSRLIVSRGAEPVPAEPSYVVDVSTGKQSQLVSTAIKIEDRLCVRYANLVLNTDQGARTLAIPQLQGCAVRSALWSKTAQAFPGLVEATPQP
jgi:hypothetical protein